MKAIHQIVAGYSHNDAISNEATVLRDVFRSWGYASEIYCDPKRILPELRHDARDVTQLDQACSEHDVALLHLSIGSMVNDIFPALPCRRAILYHNITPAEYFRACKSSIANVLAWGREQLRTLKDSAQVVMADSQYNANELIELGYKRPRVLPLVLNLDRLSSEVDRSYYRKWRDGSVNVLFVGRCVPNKRIDDALRAFSIFQKTVQPRSRFLHVGSYAGTEMYQALLRTLCHDLHLRNVEFIGTLPQAKLNACYKAADLFLCMSEHEGFCIPLIESMVNDLPILAYDAAAVPDTLDGAGIMFLEKDYPQIAEMMGRLVRDGALRRRIIAGQRGRLHRFQSREIDTELRTYLGPLLD